MKPSFAVIGAAFSALVLSTASQTQDFPVLEGPYMGQTPPELR